MDDSDDNLSSLVRFWLQLLVTLAIAGQVSILQAFHCARPNKFACSAITPCFLGVAVRAGPKSPVLQWLDHMSNNIESSDSVTSASIPSDQLATAAAREGCLDSLQWLRRRGITTFWDPLDCAELVSATPAWQRLRSSSARRIQAMHGSAALYTLAAVLDDTKMLQKLGSASHPCPFDEGTVAFLAQHGQTAALALLLPPSPTADTTSSSRLKMAYAAGKAAAAHNQLATLSWIWEHHAPSADSAPSAVPLCFTHGVSTADSAQLWEAQEDAAGISLKSFKNPDVAHWAIGISKAALDGGHVSILDWLWDRCPQAFWQQQACDYVAGRRYTSLRWLLAQYPPCQWEAADLSSHDVSRAIMHHRHLPSPGLLHQIVSSMSPDFCRTAAECGNLELLQYLHSRKCPWDGWYCLMLAACRGHLHMLQWMCDNEPSCIWDDDMSDAAAQRDQAEVLLWLLRHHPSWPLPSQPERASARSLALLVQWKCALTSAAQAQVKALGPLSPSLVIGLARWQRRCQRMGPEARRTEAAKAARFENCQGQQLSSHLSGLPDDIIMHICILADMCRPLPR